VDYSQLQLNSVETITTVAVPHKYSSRNHEFLILKENAMTATIAKLIERLAEMFPQQNYQSKLDAYLASKNIQHLGDVEHWTKQFDRQGNYL
jgi:hypothetical protein